MNFYITGVNSNNKGAELMLYAILQEIERKYPDSEVYMNAEMVPEGNGYIQSSLKLHFIKPSKIEKKIKKYHINAFFRLFFNHEGFVVLPQLPHIDYMFDASGLRFSDKMGIGLSYFDWRALCSSFRKTGTKIVFLPQCFGPIEKNATKNAVKVLYEYADMIFAREYISYNYLMNSQGFKAEKVKISTDFTSLVDGVIPEKYAHLKNAVCIIPNIQMVVRGGISLDMYIEYIKKVVQTCMSSRYNVYILNHEGKNDERLINLFRKILPREVECVSNLNALEVKGLMASAYLVITSRFHGLASGLNSCVPSLATSWSHKYSCLYADYGLEDCMLSVTNVEDDINKIKFFLQPEQNKKIRDVLSVVKPSIKTQVRNMWESIWRL